MAKLDHEAAMQAFSKFINDESLNAKQIAFVQKVIHYIEPVSYTHLKQIKFVLHDVYSNSTSSCNSNSVELHIANCCFNVPLILSLIHI